MTGSGHSYSREVPASVRLPDGRVWALADAWVDGEVDHYIELATGGPVDEPPQPKGPTP